LFQGIFFFGQIVMLPKLQRIANQITVKTLALNGVWWEFEIFHDFVLAKSQGCAGNPKDNAKNFKILQVQY